MLRVPRERESRHAPGAQRPWRPGAAPPRRAPPCTFRGERASSSPKDPYSSARRRVPAPRRLAWPLPPAAGRPGMLPAYACACGAWEAAPLPSSSTFLPARRARGRKWKGGVCVRVRVLGGAIRHGALHRRPREPRSACPPAHVGYIARAPPVSVNAAAVFAASTARNPPLWRNTRPGFINHRLPFALHPSHPLTRTHTRARTPTARP